MKICSKNLPYKNLYILFKYYVSITIFNSRQTTITAHNCNQRESENVIGDDDEATFDTSALATCCDLDIDTAAVVVDNVTRCCWRRLLPPPLAGAAGGATS